MNAIKTRLRNIKRPSNLTIGFFLFSGAFFGQRWYGYRRLKQIQIELEEKTAPLAQLPLEQTKALPKVLVLVKRTAKEVEPGVVNSVRAVWFFNKYVKPVLDAAAIDYEVVLEEPPPKPKQQEKVKKEDTMKEEEITEEEQEEEKVKGLEELLADAPAEDGWIVLGEDAYEIARKVGLQKLQPPRMIRICSFQDQEKMWPLRFWDWMTEWRQYEQTYKEAVEKVVSLVEGGNQVNAKTCSSGYTLPVL